MSYSRMSLVRMMSLERGLIDEPDDHPEDISLVYKIFLKIQSFLAKNSLVCAFAVAVIIAMAYPLPGAYLSSFEAGQGIIHIRIIEFFNNVTIFFLSGLQLKVDDIAQLKKNKLAVGYGILTINFLTTLLAFALIELPYPTKEFAIGLAIFATVPTTLGVGVALTIVAKGDAVLSLFLTITTNTIGILTVPYLLKIYLGPASEVKLDPLVLLVRLCLSIFIPSITGIMLRKYSKTIQHIMITYKTQVSITSNLSNACIVWMRLSRARDLLLEQNVIELMLVLVAAAIMHVLYLICNYCVVKHLLKFQLKQAISVIIMSSQKSSPVALVSLSLVAMLSLTYLSSDMLVQNIISNIAANPSQAGLLIIPCITGQVLQIFIGSFVAKYFSRQVKREEKSLSMRLSMVGLELHELELSAATHEDKGKDKDKVEEIDWSELESRKVSSDGTPSSDESPTTISDTPADTTYQSLNDEDNMVNVKIES
jgi:solute carrier family 10 (sodium/bile acid cotransporter), member 7